MLRYVYDWFRAAGYFLLHPFDIVTLTVVRRYVDAQGNYIGELYDGGIGCASRMIGVSCDNMPLNAGDTTRLTSPNICWRRSFLEPMPVNTLRVGAMEPADNAKVQAYIGARRFCVTRVAVLNRFVEHVMQDGPRRQVLQELVDNDQEMGL